MWVHSWTFPLFYVVSAPLASSHNTPANSKKHSGEKKKKAHIARIAIKSSNNLRSLGPILSHFRDQR